MADGKSQVLPGAVVGPRAYVLGGKPGPQCGAVPAGRASSPAEIAAYRSGWAGGFEAGRQQGFEEGHARGVEDGRRTGQAEGRQAAASDIQKARHSLAEALESLGAERARLLDEARGDILELALAIARRVIHAEIEASPRVAERVLEAAIASVQGNTVLHVRVNPREAEHLKLVHGSTGVSECRSIGVSGASESGTLPLPHSSTPPLKFVADPSIRPGGCIVETDCGAIDATVESQWDAVTAALEEAATGLPIEDNSAARGPQGDTANPQSETAGE